MDKEALLKQLDDAARQSITSWQDVFDILHSVYDFAIKTRSDFGLIMALSWHRAFARAMEILPEEGDALVIMGQMNAVIVDELLLDDSYTQEAKNEALASVIDALSKAANRIIGEMEADNPPSTPETGAKKPILH